MSREWSRLEERGSPGMVRLILWIARHMGRPAARLLLYPISLYFLVTAGPQRRASQEFFGQLTGRKPSWLQVLLHIHCFAATILDRVFFLTGRFDLFDIRLVHPEILLDRVGRRQGCILLGAHVGSFEVLRALAAERELPLKILMDPGHNRDITGVLFGLNPELRDSVIPLDDTFSLIGVHESLSAGGLVGMLGDRVADSDRIVRCRMLGREASFPAGPALLAAASAVPVILFVGLYRGGNRYDIHFELLDEQVVLARDGRQQALQNWCSRYVEKLEHYVRLAPDNWFNFYRFWDEA